MCKYSTEINQSFARFIQVIHATLVALRFDDNDHVFIHCFLDEIQELDIICGNIAHTVGVDDDAFRVLEDALCYFQVDTWCNIQDTDVFALLH